jgi:hypothetical protein
MRISIDFLKPPQQPIDANGRLYDKPIIAPQKTQKNIESKREYPQINK